jgi:hypothetical protein
MMIFAQAPDELQYKQEFCHMQLVLKLPEVDAAAARRIFAACMGQPTASHPFGPTMAVNDPSKGPKKVGF